MSVTSNRYLPRRRGLVKINIVDYSPLFRGIIVKTVDFEAEIKTTGSARAKIEIGLHCIVSLKIKCIFIPLFW